MVASDLEQDDANTFFPPGFSYPKLNLLSRHAFENVVVESGMRDTYWPRYPIPSEVDPENPCPVCLPWVGEETIFPLQIYAGLWFPYYPKLVEMYQYCHMSPTHLSPNVILTWVGFRVLGQLQGWSYSIVLFAIFIISIQIV